MRDKRLSSSIQTLNEHNSGIGGYGFCHGCHCCQGSSLLYVGVTRRSVAVSGPDAITVLLPLLALCMFPKHVNFPFNIFNGESRVMRCKDANSFSQNNRKPVGNVSKNTVL